MFAGLDGDWPLQILQMQVKAMGILNCSWIIEFECLFFSKLDTAIKETNLAHCSYLEKYFLLRSIKYLLFFRCNILRQNTRQELCQLKVYVLCSSQKEHIISPALAALRP